MKKTRAFFAILMAAVLCLSLTACGSGSTASDLRGESMTNTAVVAPSAPSAPAQGMYDSVSDYYSKDYETPAEEMTDGSSIYQNSDVKLIRRASLTIQTTQFDQSLEQLDALVDQFSGYYENAELYSGSYNNKNANRSGSYVIRIPAERYDDFLNQVGGVGHLTRKNESTENVGEIYYDLEARLMTQRTKQERLLELLKKAESMEDIIKLESALTEVEYQIEQYSSSLKRYDGLIGYATIQLDLSEVYKIVDEPTEKESLVTRMAAGFVSSFDSLVEGVQDFLIWFSYNIFGLLIGGMFVVLLVVLLRRSGKSGLPLRRKKKSQVQKEENDE